MSGMRRVRTGGGIPALIYSLKTAWRVGGIWPLYRALRTKNACKTCALGMGGQAGGMVNERGGFPEVCKKSMQAMAADMQGRIRPEFWATYSIDQLRKMTPRELEHMGRLDDPVYAGPGDTHFRPISWDNAQALCVDWLKKTPAERSFFYSSGRSSNEAAFLLQLFARLYGTNNVNNCSYYCHQASGVGLKSALGAGTATVTLDDLHHCDLLFLIGGNPASNHPRLMEAMTRLRQRGGHVVVINPIKETGLMNFSVPSNLRTLFFGQEIASHYIQPHIGGDIAVLTGIAKRIIEMSCPTDLKSEAETVGEQFWEYKSAVDKISWEEIERAAGVDPAEIDDVADIYAESKATIFAWTMGITHHTHGVDNVRAIVNLALLRGMVGKPGAGLLPIRGHSNVQGIGSMGVAPQLAQQILERIESRFGVTLPKKPGMDTLSCVEAMDRGELQAAWCVGGNLYGSNPDARWTTQAFSKLASCVYLSTTLNTGHAWGHGKETLILPVKARDEESQLTTQESMFNFVRLSDGGPARLPGPRGEVEIIAHWGANVLGDGASMHRSEGSVGRWEAGNAPDPTSNVSAHPPEARPHRSPIDWAAFTRHRDIRQAIAACVPGYEAIGEIDDTKREFQIEGRTFHEPKFNTPTGKAKFHVVPIPVLPPLEANELRLMTIRSEGQFNTVVYEEEDLYRGQDRRDIILMNPADMQRMGLREDWRVTVRSPVGEMTNIHVRPFDIHAGNAAMYAPEANILVPRTADPESRTPAFKSVVVSIQPQPAASRVVPLQVLTGR